MPNHPAKCAGVTCKSMAVGEFVSEDMPWSLAWGVGGLLLLAWALRTLNWAWWTPRRLERALRAQGLNGTLYRFPNGDLKENMRLAKEARSTPMSLTHDIVPRVLPFLRRAMDEYGKICFTWFGPVPRVTIMDPELVREVLSNKFGHFGKPKGNPLGRLFVRGLVSYEGEKWVKYRRIMNPAFHVERLKRMLPAFCACCSDLMSRWENLVGSEACYELDVWPELQSFTGDVISRTAFGSSYEEGRRIFQLQAEQAELIIQSIQNLYIPGYEFLPTPKNKRLKAVDREIRVLLRGIIKKREQAMKLGKASNDDLLGLLMESNLEHYQEHGNKNAGMTTEDVIEECKLFYFAGQETTSVLLTWTMIVLSMHPSWQVRARQEVLQAFGERKPDFDGLSRLKNVTMILYEVLRLYPPVVVLQRQTYKTMKLGDVIYPPGVMLLMPAQIMLGMIQSPKVMSNTQQALQQPQPAQVGQPHIVHSLQTVPAKVGEQSEPGSSQSLLSARQQHPTQPSISLPLASASSQSLLSARQHHPTQLSISLPLASVPPLTFQSKALPSPL
ncbi:Secologanin synthase [Musa troglodytarum]|uniref:Secologanin synthase n=1 Tax=Musa troglodytarum TaxID=320322 RepID=A0A9E7JBI2_9LILI|nr:Secologanin synthase [Musa troglodytarum]